MSEFSSLPPPAETASEDRVMAAIIYALYLVGISNGLTVLIGLILAYVSLGAAGPKMRSHYIFLIRTFWTCALWACIGGLVIAVGGVLLVVLIGFPILYLGTVIVGLAGLWFFIRSVVGAVYLAQDQAHPRPRTWLT
jgi:uncharacterized membrane protein